MTTMTVNIHHLRDALAAVNWRHAEQPEELTVFASACNDRGQPLLTLIYDVPAHTVTITDEHQ